MSIDTRTHTALHIVKGAIVQVLGEDARWSTSASTDGNHGRITVEYHEKPTDEEIAQIETQANQKVVENKKIEIHELSRSDAEARWGDLMYDKFPIPDHIQRLQIFYLPDWNVNACNKKHTKTTGEVGTIRIRKTRYRNNKNLFEVSFKVEE